jgi:hypothetical protein
LYRCSCWPVRDHDGSVVAAVAVTSNVTEEERREERLAYLAGLLDNTDDAIVALDAEWYGPYGTRAPSGCMAGRQTRSWVVTPSRSPNWT